MATYAVGDLHGQYDTFAAGLEKIGFQDSDLWLYYNEGRKTFEKYGSLSVKSRLSLLSWLKERYVIKTITVDEKKFCLTHSYYRPEFENKRYSEMRYEDVWNIVWTSVYRDDWETHGYDIYGDYDYTFITGHVPVLRVMWCFQGKDDFNE